MIAECPECETQIPLPPDTELWDLVECPNCGTHLEVVELEPPELDYALEEEEWEEEEDEEWLDEEEF
jgi:lysine biosynthesis protein LysW